MASTGAEATQHKGPTWKDKLPRMTMGEAASLLPGLAVSVAVAWLSIWLSKVIRITLWGLDTSPISPVMLAVLLGLVTGIAIKVPAVLQPGLAFAVKRILRLGIILLGIRLTVFDILHLGAYGVPIVVICLLGSLLVTTRVNRWLRLPERLGALIAVGTSICGVSAIVAAGPAIEAKEEEVAYAVAVITIFGLVATIAYPFAAHALFAGDALKVGLFLGTSVHDTSQVVGAAKVYSDVFSAPFALDVATVTKLVRNLFMAAVIPIMAFDYGRRARQQGGFSGKQVSAAKLLPLFVLGFVIMAVIRSIGDAMGGAGYRVLGLWSAAGWKSAYTSVQAWAGNLLVVALAGVGLSTSVRTLRALGIKPLLVGLGAALAVGILSFGAITLLGGFVTFQ